MLNLRCLFPLLFGCFFIFSPTAYAQPDSLSDPSLGVKAANRIKMADARHEFYQSNFRAALNLYKVVAKDEPQNAKVQMWLGKAHYHVKGYLDAEKALQKSIKLDASERETFLYLGMAQHRLGKLDEAVKSYTTYREMVEQKTVGKGKELDESEVDRFIKECQTAKTLIASPSKAKPANMGRLINSRNDDFGMVVDPLENAFFFSSRRSDTKGGMMDEMGDYVFYMDIYRCTWNEEENGWNSPDNNFRRLNTEGHDGINCITADGQFMYVYRNIFNETKSGDLYMARRGKSGKWGTPKDQKKPLNTSYWESGATVTADGETVFFLSERPGGNGQSDIYMVKRLSRKEWGEPENLGSVINTEKNENTPFISPDGKTLYFSSNGHDGMGGYDIYKSELVDGQWTKPVNMGYPLNSVNNDLHFVISPDGKKAFFNSSRAGGQGGQDLYEISLEGEWKP